MISCERAVEDPVKSGNMALLIHPVIALVHPGYTFRCKNN